MKNDHVYYLAMSHDGIVSRKLKVKEGHIKLQIIVPFTILTYRNL